MNTQTTKIPGLETLAQLRDELKLQIHLAKADVKTEWEKLEPKWAEVEMKGNALEKASVEAAKGLKAAIDLLIDELSAGYAQIRKAL
jgi:hypothetical protein